MLDANAFARGLIGAFIVAQLWSSPATAQTARTVAQKSFRSVVLLMMQDESGQPLSLGSGFFVAPGIIATNLHVVAGASRGTAKLVGRSQISSILGVVALDASADLTLLKVSIEDAPPLVIADSALISPGDEVFAVGNPQGLEGTISQGIVSGLREFGGTSILQTTAPISPGSSGGPVLNARAEVLGVAVATYKDGQNLNFAVAAKHLSALIASSGNSEMLPIGTLRSSKPTHSELGRHASQGIEIRNEHLRGSLGATYRHIEFSASNQLSRPVRGFRYVVIYREPDGSVFDSKILTVQGPILPGLATRVPATGFGPIWVDGDLVSRHGLNSTKLKWMESRPTITDTQQLRRIYEIRVLDIEVEP